MNGKSMNDNHPECREDELWITNVADSKDICYKNYRLGTAYNNKGCVIKDSYAVFVTKDDYSRAQKELEFDYNIKLILNRLGTGYYLSKENRNET